MTLSNQIKLTIPTLLILGFWATTLLIIPPFTSWGTKMFIGAIISLLCFVSSVKEGTKIERDNFFWGLFVVFSMGVYFMQPNVKHGNYEIYNSLRTVLLILCYYLGYLSISNHKFSDSETNMVQWHLMAIGTLIGAYVIFQYFGFDEFFDFRSDTVTSVNSKNPHLFGTLGNSRICGAFLLLIIPYVLVMRQWIFGAIILVAIVLIESKMVFFGGAAMFLFLFARSRREFYGIFVIVILIAIAYYQLGHHDSGRLHEWTSVWKVFQSRILVGQHVFTGFGFESFRTINRMIGSAWWPIHNEYFEILWATGFIGFGLFLAGFVKEINELSAARRTADLLVVLASIVMAFWLFIWQIGPIALLTVYALGMSKQHDDTAR